MPTYDYVCRACEHRFEHFQSMSEPALRKCPECGRLKLQRLIGSGAGILFKGSGFYETDYKRKSPPAPASDGADPSPSKGGAPADSGQPGGSKAPPGSSGSASPAKPGRRSKDA